MKLIDQDRSKDKATLIEILGDQMSGDITALIRLDPGTEEKRKDLDRLIIEFVHDIKQLLVKTRCKPYAHRVGRALTKD